MEMVIWTKQPEVILNISPILQPGSMTKVMGLWDETFRVDGNNQGFYYYYYYCFTFFVMTAFYILFVYACWLIHNQQACLVIQGESHLSHLADTFIQSDLILRLYTGRYG